MPACNPDKRNGKTQRTAPFPYAMMEKQPHVLDRLELQFQWGAFGFRVLRCHLASFAPSQFIPFHKHSNYEFHFISRGKGKVMIEQAEYELREGMFYLTGPNVMHQQTVDPNDPMKELCLHLDIVPLDLDGTLSTDDDWGQRREREEAAACVKGLNELPLYPAEDRFQAMPWFLAAFRAWDENDPFFHSTFKQAIIQILQRSVRAYQNKEAFTPMPERDMNLYRYELAIQFIQDNYAGPITLEEVAAKIHISGRQLQRIFREQSGGSFSEYLESIRLAHICNHLIQDHLPLEEIAAKHGFSSSNYLYYVFKKRYGMTPGAFRAQHAASHFAKGQVEL
jgi:AraC-like DNA-binding protein/quercetin dioxygenase-like cupin family protein